MEKKLVRGQIDCSNTHLKTELGNHAFQLFMKRLGQKNEENARAYEQSRQQGISLWEQYKEQLMPHGNFVFSNGGKLPLTDMEQKHLQAELTVILFYEEILLESVFDQYLMHLWQISYLDCVREYLQKVYIKTLIQYYCNEEALYISPWLGPGLGNIPIEKTEEFLTHFFSKNDEIDNIIRKKSFVGRLISTYEAIDYPSPCQRCKGQSGCEYCMIFMEQRKQKEDRKS